MEGVSTMDSLGFSMFCEIMAIFHRESQLIEGPTLVSLMDNPYQLVPQSVRIFDELNDISHVDPHVPTAMQWIEAYKDGGYFTRVGARVLPGCPFYVPMFCHKPDKMDQAKSLKYLKELLEEKGEKFTSQMLKAALGWLVG